MRKSIINSLISSKIIINDDYNQEENSPPPVLYNTLNDKLDDKEKEIYFIVLLPNEEKIDFTKVKFKSVLFLKLSTTKSLKREMNHILKK